MRWRLVASLMACALFTISAMNVWAKEPAVTAYADDTTAKQITAVSLLLYNAELRGDLHASYLYVQRLRQLAEGQGHSKLAAEAAELERMSTDSQSSASQKRIELAARLQLAADAAANPERSLWRQYEMLLLDNAAEAVVIWRSGDGERVEKLLALLGQMEDHLDRIGLAAQISGEQALLSQLEQQVQQIKQLVKQTEEFALADSLVAAALSSQILNTQQLFAGVEASPALQPLVGNLANANPLGWSLAFCALISAVLSYSAWQKYRLMPYGIKPID